MAPNTAELAYALVYSATKGHICLQEDQITAAIYFHEQHDTAVGGGGTMQIVAAALLNPGKVILRGYVSIEAVARLYVS